MKRVLFLILMLCLSITALAGEFNKKVSILGGSPVRLNTALNSAGYNGTMSVDEVTFCNNGANTVYIGQNNVSSTNGFELAVGMCKTERRGAVAIDLSQKYLWVTATQNVDVSLRSQ